MLSAVELQNFRGFKRFRMENFAQFNFIVGDNGAGKTGLLESLFLPMCGNPQKALALRQWRGLEGKFLGSPESILEAMYSELFYGLDVTEPATISVTGEGVERRSLVIERGPAGIHVPIESKEDASVTGPPQIVAPIVFRWIDHSGAMRVAYTRISQSGLEFDTALDPVEGVHFFPASWPVPAEESAQMFSELSKSRKEKKFKERFLEIFPMLEDISVETHGGTPMMHGAVKGLERLIPLANVSSGVNRTLAMLAAIARRKNSILFVDEADEGIFHEHHEDIVGATLDLAREAGVQLFLTTHNEEWLAAASAVVERHDDSVAFWRMERTANVPVARRFTAREFIAGQRLGDMR